MEEIAAASKGPKWFQMYLNVGEGLSREVLQRAKAARFQAIIHTIDAIGQGSSDEYIRHNKARPWLPYGNFKDTGGKANAFKTDLSWKDTEMIQKVTGLPGPPGDVRADARRRERRRQRDRVHAPRDDRHPPALRRESPLGARPLARRQGVGIGSGAAVASKR